MNQYDSVDGVAQTYDANGNLQEDGSFFYHWDAENQLIEVRDSSNSIIVAQYSYDPFGRRIRKRVDPNGSDEDSWFFWKGDRVVEELDDSGNLRTRYVYAEGYAPVAVEIESGSGLQSFYVHSDHLDTPRLLSDDQGAIAWRGDYWAFGKAEIDGSSTETFDIRLPGQHYDKETGLHYNYHRYYDPNVGRYLSPDPLGQYGGPNVYLYSYNQPTAFIDPSGELACGGVCIAAGIWAAVELSLAVYDLYDATATLVNPCMDAVDKGIAVAGLGVGLILPGGGYGTAGKQVAKRLRRPTDRLKEQLLERAGKAKSQTALDAARRELAGEATGFDHVTKVRNAQRGLVNRIQQIRRQLARAELDDVERQMLKQELGDASRLLDYSRGFVP